MTEPHRTHELMCKISADSREALVGYLRHLTRELERGEIGAGVSGGYSSGAIYAYRHDPSVTHDSYFAELEQMWAEQKRAQAEAERVSAAVS